MNYEQGQTSQYWQPDQNVVYRILFYPYNDMQVFSLNIISLLTALAKFGGAAVALKTIFRLMNLARRDQIFYTNIKDLIRRVNPDYRSTLSTLNVVNPPSGLDQSLQDIKEIESKVSYISLIEVQDTVNSISPVMNEMQESLNTIEQFSLKQLETKNTSLQEKLFSQ